MTELERCDEIREFVLDNYPPAHQWQPKMAEDWTGWAAEQGFLYLCYDKEKLVGLTIARPLSIRRLGTQVEDTDFDPDGEAIYIDTTISTAGKPAMQSMMLGILRKMGNKPILAFKRLKTADKIKTYRLGDFANRLLGR